MPERSSSENLSLHQTYAAKEHDFAPHVEPISPISDNNDSEDSHIHGSDTDTATGSSDEFDWDEDEEPKEPTEHLKATRGRALWLAFMKLARPLRVLLVCILGGGILITPLLVVQFKFHSNVVRPQVHAWSLWFAVIWLSACITYLIVDSIPRLVVSTTVLFGGQVERLKIQLELTMAVSGWIKVALDITWAWISLSIIRTVYNPSGSYWTVVNQVMQALFSAGLILLVEKLFLQFVAINFHQKALADRIAENRLGLKALDRLSNTQPAPSQKRSYGKRGHKSPVGSIGTLLDFTSLQHRGRKSGRGSTDASPLHENSDHREKNKDRLEKLKDVKSAERKRKRRSAMRSIIVDQVGGAIGQVALKNSKFNREGEIGGLYSARRLARKLFNILSDVSPPRAYLVVEDFYPYFHTTEEAHEAFKVFDKDSNGDISKKEMREAVQRIYRERKSLIASLKDVGSAVAKLDAVLIAIALIAFIFICLLIFSRQDTLSSLVPLATIILGFSFVFGHSAQLLFESLIFIFSTHVFDVGDLVMIDDQPLLVREFGLFSTTFRRVDGQEIIAPNALLASSKLIHNLRRSNSMWETTNLTISYNTPLEIIEQLRSRINNYVAQNNREWSSCSLNIDKMTNQNAIYLIVAMEHRSNWQDWGGRWTRRTAFMRHLKTVLEELDVGYSMPVQPVLLPRPSATPRSPFLQPPPAQSRGKANREALGNAGSFQPGENTRSPTTSIRSGGDKF